MAKLKFFVLFCFSPKDFRGDPGSSRADTVRSHSALRFRCTRGWSLLGMSFCVPSREAEPRVKFSPDRGEDGVWEGKKPKFPLFVVRGSGLMVTPQAQQEPRPP